MSNEIKKSKKITFGDPEETEIPEVPLPQADEDVAVQTLDLGESTKEETEKLEEIKEEVRESVVEEEPKPTGIENDFVQPDGPVIPKEFNLRDEMTKLLVVNTDEDMIKTLVKFEGMGTNYYLVSVHPQRIYDAWKLYAENEGIVPGRFMEMVFDIINVPNRRYFHKVSTVELR